MAQVETVCCPSGFSGRPLKKETPAQPRGPAASPQAKAFDTTHLGPRVQKPKPPTSGQPQILFSVRGCDGRSFELGVQPETSVQQLKVKIAGTTGIPVQSLILFAENKPLEDGKILRDFQPKGPTELLVVHKVYGG